MTPAASRSCSSPPAAPDLAAILDAAGPVRLGHEASTSTPLARGPHPYANYGQGVRAGPRRAWPARRGARRRRNNCVPGSELAAPTRLRCARPRRWTKWCTCGRGSARPAAGPICWLSEFFAESARPPPWSSSTPTPTPGRRCRDGGRLPPSPTTRGVLTPAASGAATVSEAIATSTGSVTRGRRRPAATVAYVGEDNFTTGLRAYLARDSYGNAALADLVAAVGQARPGPRPLVRHGWRPRGRTCCAASPTPTRPGSTDSRWCRRHRSGTRPRPHRVAVGLYRRSGDSLARAGRLVATCPGPGPLFVAARGARA